MAHLLLVDDDLQSLESTKKILELAGHQVTVAMDGEAALQVFGYLGQNAIDLVVSDVRMPKLTGLEFLKALSVSGNRVPVILMTAFGRIEDAVWAMKFGAVDFLSKPFKRQALLDSVASALKRVGTTASVSSEWGMIGKSSAMEALKRMIAQVGPTTATVLVQGEGGTGKERVARALHDSSVRKNKPFVAINCAALPDSLLESELFGYERGAFTGAHQAKPGLFESAHGGSLLLDEIGDMPLSLQAKLLRVIQEGEVRRLGSSVARKIDIRLIAATHRDLKTMVSEGRFRQDLLFRLEVVGLDLPPLRDRGDDIVDLAQDFLERFALKHSKPGLACTTAVLEVLRAYSWPGNVRESQNVIERSVIFARPPNLELSDLPAHIVELSRRQLNLGRSEVRGEISVPLGTSLRDVEDLLIRKTLEATQGDKNVTAKLLGINSRTIYRKLKEEGPGEGETL